MDMSIFLYKVELRNGPSARADLSIETGRQMTEFLREHGLHPIILKNSMS